MTSLPPLLPSHKPAPEKRPKKAKRVRSDAHLKWVRQHACCVPGCDRRPIEAAHVRSGLPNGEQGGMSMKPGDDWTISLCGFNGSTPGHHQEQHQIGEAAFEKKYGIDMRELAKRFAEQSPHRAKLREKRHALDMEGKQR